MIDQIVLKVSIKNNRVLFLGRRAWFDLQLGSIFSMSFLNQRYIQQHESRAAFMWKGLIFVFEEIDVSWLQSICFGFPWNPITVN